MDDAKWKAVSVFFGVVILTIALGGFFAKPLDLATCEARGGLVFTSVDCESV